MQYEDLSDEQKDFCAELMENFNSEFYANIDQALSSGALSEKDAKGLDFIRAVFVIIANSVRSRSVVVDEIVKNLKHFI